MLESQPIWPAALSALAAGFSAVAAGMMLIIHLRNRADAVRPELVLEGWTYEESRPGKEAWGFITINKIKNVGRGHAFRIRPTLIIPGAHEADTDSARSHIKAELLSILVPEESIVVNWAGTWRWTEDANGPDANRQNLKLTIQAVDSHERTYTVVYALVAMRRGLAYLGQTELAPRLYLTWRYTAVVPRWRVRLRGWYSKKWVQIARRWSLRWSWFRTLKAQARQRKSDP